MKTKGAVKALSPQERGGEEPEGPVASRVVSLRKAFTFKSLNHSANASQIKKNTDSRRKDLLFLKWKGKYFR